MQSNELKEIYNKTEAKEEMYNSVLEHHVKRLNELIDEYNLQKMKDCYKEIEEEVFEFGISLNGEIVEGKNLDSIKGKIEVAKKKVEAIMNAKLKFEKENNLST